jgi:hypothetical protein
MKMIEEGNAIIALLDGTTPAPVKKTRVSKKKETEEVAEEKTEKKTTKKAAAKAPTEKTSETDAPLRIPRMTPAIKKKLDEVFKEVGIEKDDKVYAQYREFINSMTVEEYDRYEDKSHHMAIFAESKGGKVQEGSNAGGGGPKLPAHKKVSELKNLKEVQTGVFQDTDGTLLTGPAEDIDEDMEDATFNGEEYILGTKTKRVYKADPAGGPDVFVGFWGIGKFAGADD